MVSNIKNFVYFALFILLSTTVYAADLMSFTANVKDGSGNAISSGDIVVEIYDAATVGNLIYNSTDDFFNNISNGQVDLMLGSGTQGLNLIYGNDYYMEVYVNRVDLDFQGKERQQFQAGSGNVTLGRLNVSTSFVPAANNTYNIGQQNNGWWSNIFGVTGYFLSKIGIGTTSPSEALNVTGNVGGTGLTGLSSSTYNATYDQWSYNQTTGAINYITSGGALTSIQGNNTYIKTGGALTTYSNIALTNQSDVFSGNITLMESNFTVNGSVFYVEGKTGKVGIGTTSPSSALNVTGDVGVTGIVTANAFVGSGTGLTGLSSSTYNATYDQWSYNQTTGAINYITSGGALTSIQGNNTYIKTGGALTTYSNIALTNQSTTFTLNLTTSDTLIATNSLNVNSGKLIVTQIGNVGIGTTTPGTILNISAATNQKIYIKKAYLYDNGNALVLGHD